MNYKAIFLHAYILTVRNPVLWIFGLFLSGGFNLNIIYAIVSDHSGSAVEAIRRMINDHPVMLGLGGLAAIIIFLIANYLKVWFINEAHRAIHPSGAKCPQCVQRESEHTLQKRLPKWNVLLKVYATSALTIIATVVTVAPLNYLLKQSDQTSPGLITATIVATAIIVCALACWNIFTTFYITLHKQNFTPAGKLSLDLITLRIKPVFEFVLILLLIYVVIVAIGSGLILLAQLKIEILSHWSVVIFPVLSSGKALAGLLFGLWAAITNTFFNLALLLFFDRLVKPIEKPAEVPGALPQSAQ